MSDPESFISHLVELRQRLIRSLIAIGVALGLLLFVWPGAGAVYDFLALPIVIGSSVLFFVGVAFCYFFVFGRVFAFINEFAPKSITPAPDIEAYLSFVLTMFLAFGIAFEIPIVVIVLVRAGVVSVQKLVEIRPYVILGNAVAAAIVTPPDLVSMLALLLPMCLLYEAGLFLARFISVRSKSEDESVASVQKPLH